MEMLARMDVALNSIRLDRYYSKPSYVDMFARDTLVFVVPKSNVEWFMEVEGHDGRILYWHDKLSEGYYGGENSESGFSADWELFGWPVAQKREDRIDCSQLSVGPWHNLFSLGAQ